MNSKSKALHRKISFPKKEIVNEHKKLVKDLRSGNKKKLLEQAKEQGRELKQYEKK